MDGFDRVSMVEKLKHTDEWDVLVVGGGATGLGVAVDAATRGFKILLAEQEDFAKGTSSRSTKLVHGGVRYLAQGNISLVREALKERGLLLKNAPHLTRNMVFVIPCYSWFRGFFYAFGLKLYDWLSGRLSLGQSKMISRKSVLKRLPVVEKKSLKCGVIYHDGAFDDARLAINLAQTAVDNGAVVLNYFKVVSLRKNEKRGLSGATIEDRESGRRYEVKARVIVNATGVFADNILQLDNPEAKSIIRPSQGVHLVLDKSFLQSDNAIMIPHTDDGRVLFAIPWHEHVLIGTTDTPLSSHSLEPRALDSEIDFILKNAGTYLARQPKKSDVMCVFAGLRPLAATDDNNEKTKEISRRHKIIFSDSGLVSVFGGKWTTYRKMAEDTLDKIMKRRMLPTRHCITMDLKIHGYQNPQSADEFSTYGSDEFSLKKLMDKNPEQAKSLINGIHLNEAQVIWAIRNEMARTVEDILARRTRILFFDARAAIEAAPEVAEIMRKNLNYDESWKQSQITSFTELAKGYLIADGLS
ncbi:MAG: glycerol-3-phosphate dehydrogenase/oxidase [Chitinophagaceae bacterium]|nr:glycerol-3-phosphate dehydrogenase/oxidase [Chitinophagaceae bacterium]